MKATLKRKLGLCFLVLIVVGLGIAIGGDVVVREGNLDVAGDLTVCSDIFLLDNLYVDGFISGSYPGPDAYLDDVYAYSLNVTTDLYVGGSVNADYYLEHSSFYEKDVYGEALDYLGDSSYTIKINAQGEKEYDHGADPVFLQRRCTVTEPDKYTEKKVWNEELNKYQTVRVHETREEWTSDLGMKVAWLRQCVFELKQENEMLKVELAKVKARLGVE